MLHRTVDTVPFIEKANVALALDTQLRAGMSQGSGSHTWPAFLWEGHKEEIGHSLRCK